MKKLFLSTIVRRYYRDPLRRLRYMLGESGKRRDMVEGEGIGKALQLLAGRREFLNYVEIGTAHGLGSTKLLMDVLMTRDDKSALWSLEALPASYQAAVKNWQQIAVPGRLHLLYGIIVRSHEMMSWQEVTAHPMYHGMRDYCHSKYGTYRNVCDEAPFVLASIPQHIDVLVLDGGEFTSFAEFEKLHARTQVICLDETHHAIKNYYVREQLEASVDWCLLCSRPDERKGWAVFCKTAWEKPLRPAFIQAGLSED